MSPNFVQAHLEVEFELLTISYAVLQDCAFFTRRRLKSLSWMTGAKMQRLGRVGFHGHGVIDDDVGSRDKLDDKTLRFFTESSMPGSYERVNIVY